MLTLTLFKVLLMDDTVLLSITRECIMRKLAVLVDFFLKEYRMKGNCVRQSFCCEW